MPVAGGGDYLCDATQDRLQIGNIQCIRVDLPPFNFFSTLERPYRFGPSLMRGPPTVDQEVDRNARVLNAWGVQRQYASSEYLAALVIDGVLGVNREIAAR